MLKNPDEVVGQDEVGVGQRLHPRQSLGPLEESSIRELCRVRGPPDSRLGDTQMTRSAVQDVTKRPLSSSCELPRFSYEMSGQTATLAEFLEHTEGPSHVAETIGCDDGYNE